MIWTAYLVNPSSFSDSKYYREIYMTNNVEDSEPFYWENFENKLIQKNTGSSYGVFWWSFKSNIGFSNRINSMLTFW